jgi:hypothetical protein
MTTTYLPARVADYLDAYPAISSAQLAAALDVGYATASVYRSRWRAQQRATEPEKVYATILGVRVAEDGFTVRYRNGRGTEAEATLPAGEQVPALRQGWYGVLVIWQGAIITAEEAA